VRSLVSSTCVCLGLSLAPSIAGIDSALAADADPSVVVPLKPAPATGKTTPGGDPDAKIILRPGSLAPVVYPSAAARFGVPDLVVTGLGGATALVSIIVGPNREFGPRGGVLFDEDVRDLVRATDYTTQLAVRDASDVLLGFSMSYAFIGDALINATWLRKSPDVGAQIALLDVEVVALTLGIQQLVVNGIARERPYGRTCGTSELDERSSFCITNDRYVSHFSGHAAAAFALAAVTCAHHSAIPLSNGQAWIPCLSGFVGAAATAGLRVVGDMHYASDILVGAAVGTTIGFLVPALHYGIGSWTPHSPISGVSFNVLPTPQGVMVSGVW